MTIHDRGVSFAAPTNQTIAAGDTATAIVTLASPAIGAIDVPILITGREKIGTANEANLPDDFRLVSFADGEQTKTVTPAYVAPADADGSEILYVFDFGGTGNADGVVINGNTIPAWPTEIGQNNAIIEKLVARTQLVSTINVQNAAVNFVIDPNAGSDVRQGGTVAGLSVSLSGNAPSTQISLPVKITNKNDSSDVSYINVDILSGQNSGVLNHVIAPTETADKILVYTFDTDSDGNDGGSNPAIAVWPTGINISTTVTTPEVTVRDSGVSFETASPSPVNVRAGSTTPYKIALQSDAIGDLILPISTNGGTPENVTILNGEDNLPRSFSAPAGAAGTSVVVKLLEKDPNDISQPNPAWPVDARADTPKEVTFNITDPTINFAQAVYNEYEGDISTVTVSLPGGAIGATPVPIIKRTFYTDPNTPVLKEGINVLFGDGDIAQNVEPAPVAPIPNDGTIDRIEYEFDSDNIPANATYKVGTVGSTIVDVFSKEVRFTQPNYDIPPDQPNQSVTIKLGSITKTSIAKINRDIPVNITYHYTDGTSSTSAAVTPTPQVTATNSSVDIEYVQGDGGANVASVSYAFDTTDSAWQTAKFREGAINTSRITINAGSVNFVDATPPLAKAGDTVAVKVKLLANNISGNPIRIPLIKTVTDTSNNATLDYSHFVDVPNNSDEGTLSYTIPTNQHGYKIKFTFDDDDNDDVTYAWPASLVEGTVTPATEFMVSHGKISFDRNADDVAPSGTLENINLNLASNSAQSSFDVPVKVTRVNNGTSNTTYEKIAVGAGDIVALFDITANAGDTSITYTLDTNDTDDGADDSINGNWPAQYDIDGTPASIVVTVSADAVNFNTQTATIREGGTPDIKIILAQSQQSIVPIALKRTLGNATPEYIKYDIPALAKEFTIPYRIPVGSAGQDLVYEFDDDNSDDSTHDWPASLNVGSAITISTVSIKAGGVRFGALANNGKIRIGGEVDFDVILDSPALQTGISLPYSYNGTAVSTPLAYGLGEFNKTIRHTAPADRSNIGQTGTYILLDGDSNWSADAHIEGPNTLIFTWSDPNIDFAIAADTAAEDADVKIHINLPGGAIGATAGDSTIVPLTYTVTKSDGTIEDPEDISVTFADGAIAGFYDYKVPVGENIASVEFAFDTGNPDWPDTLDATSTDIARVLTSTLTIGNGYIEFDGEADDVAAENSLDITLNTEIDVAVDTPVPVKRTEYNGNVVVGTPTYPIVTVLKDADTNPDTVILEHTPPAVGVTKVEYELDENYATWPFGFSEGTFKKFTVNITDSAINFESDEYLTKTGETVTNMKLLLTKALTSGNPVDVPIEVREYAAGSNSYIISSLSPIIVTVPLNAIDVVLPAYLVPADAQGKRFEYRLDTNTTNWPTANFTVGSAAPEAMLHVRRPISFNQPDYDVAASGSVPVTLNFETILHDPTIQIPLKVTTNDGVNPAIVTYRNVTLANPTDTFITFSHQAPAGSNGTIVKYEFDGDDNNDSENGTIDWHKTLFYAGSQADTDVNIDNKFVNFSIDKQNLREGGTAKVKLVLVEKQKLAGQSIAVKIPIIIKETGKADSPVIDVIIPADRLESDDLEHLAAVGDAGNTVTYEFANVDANGNLPYNDMKAGLAVPTSEITVTDSSANFEFALSNVREGKKNVKVKLKLASPAIDPITVTADKIFTKGVDDLVNASLTDPDGVDFVFPLNADEATYEFDVLENSASSNYRFPIRVSDLPVDVRFTTPSPSAIYNVQDADVNFVKADDVFEIDNTTKEVKIILKSPAIGDVTIPLAVTKNGVVEDPVDVLIKNTESEGVYEYTPVAADAGTVFIFSLDENTANWPINYGVTPGEDIISSKVIIGLGEVNFVNETLETRKGTKPIVKLSLSKAPLVPVTIPITVKIDGVVSAGDATTAVFDPNNVQPEVAQIVIASPLSGAIGTVYTYEIGATLPPGVTMGSDASSEVTLTSDAIDFDGSVDSIRAGLDIDSKIKLVAAAGLDEDGNDGIKIPIIRTFTPDGSVLGGGDDVVTYVSSETFSKTDTEQMLKDTTLASEGGGTITYTFDTGSAGNDNGNNPNIPKWPVGFTPDTGAGRIDTRTITVIDSSIAFDQATRDVDYGISETVTVTLATAPAAGTTIVVPIIRTKIDANGVPVVATPADKFDLTFTGKTKTITYGDDADEKDVGDTKITYAFDTSDAIKWAAAKVSLSTAANAVNQTTLTIVNTAVDFETPAVDFRAADNNATPPEPAINYGLRKHSYEIIKIKVDKKLLEPTRIYYDIMKNGVSFESNFVEFDSDDVINDVREKTIYFTSDSADREPSDIFTYEFDDDHASWPIYIDAAASNVNIEIQDSDAYFEAADYDVRRTRSANIVMKLATAAVGTLKIPYRISGDNTVYEAVFNDGDDSYPITHTTTASDAIDSTVTYSISEPAAIALNVKPSYSINEASDPDWATRPSTATVKVLSDEIGFDSDDVTVREGDAINFKVILAAPADRDGMEVTLKSVWRAQNAPNDGSADVVRTPLTVTFNKNATEKIERIVNDTAGVSEKGTIIYSFDDSASTWPSDVKVPASPVPIKAVTVNDSAINFETDEYIIGYGSKQKVVVKLASPAITDINNIQIKGTVVNIDTTTADINETIDFPITTISEGEHTASFEYDTNDYGVGSVVTYKFVNLPANVKAGSVDEIVIKVEQIGVQFELPQYNTVNGQNTTIKVKLESKSSNPLTLSIGNSDPDSVQSVTFLPQTDEKEVTIPTSALLIGDGLSYSFTSLPDELKGVVPTSTTIAITDSKVEFVTLSSTPDIDEDAKFSIRLPAEATSETPISLTRKTIHADGDIKTYTFQKTFDIGEKTKEFTDAIPNLSPWLTAEYGFGELENGYTVGDNATHTVTSAQQTASFAQPTYKIITDSNISVNIPVTLSSVATQAYEVIVNLYDTTGGTNPTPTPYTLNFAIGDKTKNLVFTGDTNNQTGDTYVYSFKSFSSESLISGAHASTEITLIDPISVTIERAGDTLEAGDDIAARIILGSPAPAEGVNIPVLIRRKDADGNIIPNQGALFDAIKELEFEEGEYDKTFIHKVAVAADFFNTFTLTYDDRVELIVGASAPAGAVLPEGYQTATGNALVKTLDFSVADDSVSLVGGDIAFFKNDSSASLKFNLSAADSSNLKLVRVARSGVIIGNTDISIPQNRTEHTHNLTAAERNTLGTTTYTITDVQDCIPLTTFCLPQSSTKIGAHNSKKITILSNLISFESPTISGNTASFNIIKLALDTNVKAPFDITIPLTRDVTVNGETTTETVNVTIPKSANSKNITVKGSDYAGNDAVVKYSLPTTLPYGLVAGANSSSQVNIRDTYISFVKKTYDLLIGTTQQIYFEIKRRSASGATGSNNAVIDVKENGIDLYDYPAPITANDTAVTKNNVLGYDDGDILTISLLPTHSSWAIPASETYGPIKEVKAYIHAKPAINFASADDGHGIAGDSKVITLTRLGATTDAIASLPVKMQVNNTDRGTVNAVFAAGASTGTVSVDLTNISVGSVVTLVLDENMTGWNADYIAGNSNSSTEFIVVASDDIAVRFGYEALIANADETGNVSVKLDRKATEYTRLPVTIVTTDESANTSSNPITVYATFLKGAQSTNVAYNTKTLENGDTITYGFGTLPAGYVKSGTTDSTIITVVSETNTIEFATASSADKFTNEDVIITVNLGADAVAKFTAILQIQKTEGTKVTTSTRSITFDAKDRSKTFTYNTANDGHGTDSIIEFSFITLPSVVSRGTQTTHGLTVKDSSISFVGAANRDAQLEFNSAGVATPTLATPRSGGLTVDLVVTDIDAHGNASNPPKETITFPANSKIATQNITYNATALTDAGKQRIYRLPNAAVGVAPSRHGNFDYRFQVSRKLLWVDMEDTTTFVGQGTTVTLRVLEPVTSTSEFEYKQATISSSGGNKKKIPIVRGKQVGTTTFDTSALAVGDIRYVRLETHATQYGYHVDPNRSFAKITMIAAPNQTIKFAEEYSVAKPGEDVVVQWQSAPAYQTSVEADRVSIKRTYIAAGGNETNGHSSDIVTYSGTGNDNVTVTVPSTLSSGNDMVVEFENIPTGYGAVNYKKHTIYTPRGISFATTAYVGAVGTHKTEMKLRANNSLPKAVPVPVTVVVKDGDDIISEDTLNLTFDADSNEKKFSYNVPTQSTHIVEFSLPAEFDDKIIQPDISNLTATLFATAKINDVAFTKITSNETYTSTSLAGRTIRIPVTIAANTTLYDGAEVALAIDVRQAFGNAGAWQNATALLKKDSNDDTHYVEYVLPSSVSGDGVLGLRLQTNNNISIASNNTETNIVLDDTVASQLPVTVMFADASNASNYDVVSFKITFSQTLPYPVDIPLLLEYAAATDINGLVHPAESHNVTVQMPKDTLTKTFNYAPLHAHSVSATTPRNLTMTVSPAYDGMTIQGSTTLTELLETYPIDLGLDQTETVAPTNTIEVRFSSSKPITEYQDTTIPKPEITLHIRTKIDDDPYSAWQTVTEKVTLFNPSAWSADGKRTSNQITIPYTVPQFDEDMRVGLKLGYAPGLFVPSNDNDKKVVYTISKPTTQHVVSFTEQDLPSILPFTNYVNVRPFDEKVKVKFSVSPSNSNADIKVPIIITYTPQNSIKASATVLDELIIKKGEAFGELEHTTLPYHNHIVRYTADVSATSNISIDASKNYSQYTASANRIYFKSNTGSGTYASEGQYIVTAKTYSGSPAIISNVNPRPATPAEPAYSDMKVKSQYRTKFGTGGAWSAWQEVITDVSKGNTQNGFNLSYDLPEFTENGQIEIELLDNETGNAVRRSNYSHLHEYSGTINRFTGNRIVGFATETLPDIIGGQIYKVPMILSQAFSTDTPIDVKIEYIDRDSGVVLETDNKQSVIFEGTETMADFTQVAPDKHNVWIKVTAVPASNSGIIVNSASSYSRMKLDGHQFAFATDNISGTHAAGDTITFQLIPTTPLLSETLMPIEFRTIINGTSTAWVAASSPVKGYGNVVNVPYQLPNNFDSGTMIVEARLNVGTDVYDANDPNNNGYLETSYLAYSSTQTARVINFAGGGATVVKAGSKQEIRMRLVPASSEKIKVPLIIEHRDKSNGDKLIFTDRSHSVEVPAGEMDFSYDYTMPYRDNFRIRITTDFPADYAISDNGGRDIDVHGYEASLNVGSLSLNRAPSSNVTIAGKISPAAPANAIEMPYRFRTRIYGEEWQEWQERKANITANATTFNLTAQTPSQNYTNAVIEFELIDDKLRGFTVGAGNARTIVNLKNTNIGNTTYKIVADASTPTSTTYIAGNVVKYDMEILSGGESNMSLPMKAVFTKRGTNDFISVERFKVPHSANTVTHHLEYTLPNRDNQDVTISLDLPIENSLFTAVGADTDVTFKVNSYRLKFGNSDKSVSSFITKPGDSITVKLQRQSGVSYKDVAAIMQRRTQIDDGTWSDWYNFPVALGTSQNTDFKYVVPQFTKLFNLQIRLKPGDDSGAVWQSGQVNTYNYNIISPTAQTGIIRLTSLGVNYNALSGADIPIEVTLYDASNVSEIPAIEDLIIPVRVESTSNDSEIVLITIPKDATKASIVYPVPFVSAETFFSIELAMSGSSNVSLNPSGAHRSTGFKTADYTMEFADDGSEIVAQAGDIIATQIWQYFGNQIAETDIDLPVVRRVKYDDGEWGLWEPVAVTMPEGTKGKYETPKGFDYNWQVPAYNRKLEVQMKLLSTPEKAIKSAGQKVTHYTLFKEYAIEFANAQNHASFIKRNHSNGGGNIMVPITVYGPKRATAAPFNVNLETRFINAAGVPNNSGSSTLLSASILTTTEDSTDILLSVPTRERGTTSGSYRYVVTLQPPADIKVINNDTKRIIDTYYPVQISHAETQTNSDYANATYTMSIADYNSAVGTYETAFSIPIKLWQTTTTNTVLKYSYRKRLLLVSGSAPAWSNSVTGTPITIPPQTVTRDPITNKWFAEVDVTIPIIDAAPSNSNAYGWEYQITLLADGSNYTLKSSTDVSRVYKVNQHVILEHGADTSTDVSSDTANFPNYSTVGNTPSPPSSGNLSNRFSTATFPVTVRAVNGTGADPVTVSFKRYSQGMQFHELNPDRELWEVERWTAIFSDTFPARQGIQFVYGSINGNNQFPANTAINAAPQTINVRIGKARHNTYRDGRLIKIYIDNNDKTRKKDTDTTDDRLEVSPGVFIDGDVEDLNDVFTGYYYYP